MWLIYIFIKLSESHFYKQFVNKINIVDNYIILKKFELDYIINSFVALKLYFQPICYINTLTQTILFNSNKFVISNGSKIYKE